MAVDDDQLRALFPRLRLTRYTISSEQDPSYNCIAWAVGRNDKFWSPLPYYYWPPNALPEWSVEALAQIFQALGYIPCESSELDADFEKVAIYVDDNGEPTHIARQLPSGFWTSKLGMLEDIEHETLGALEQSEYGRVGLVLSPD